MSATLVKSVLSRQLDDLDPTLTRHGFRVKDVAEQFDAGRPRSRRSNALEPVWAAALRDRMMAAGRPI